MRSRWRACALIPGVCASLVTIALPAARLSAQSAPLRAAIDALQDSLTVDSLGTLPITPDPGARTPEDRLRAGYIMLGRGRQAHDPAMLARAADQFYEVTVKRSHWPYAWYGLGLAKSDLALLRSPEVRSAHQPAGSGWANMAASALERAGAEDSTFRPALLALARLQPLLSPRSSGDPVQVALRRATTVDPSDPMLWVYAGRAARARRDHAEALEDFRRAAGAAGAGPRGVIDLELARELFAAGLPDSAAECFYAGLSATDSASVALYRHDLALAADSAELVEWDSLSPGARDGWVREFWAKRERASGRPAGTRLPEHYRRFAYASDHFAAPAHWAREFVFGMEILGLPPDFDDRGAVYLRHGQPDLTSTFVGGMGTAPNESWLYYRPEGNLVFHFVGRGHLVPTFLVASRDTAGILESRMGLDPRYGELAIEIENEDAIVQSDLTLARKLGLSRDGRNEPPLVALSLRRTLQADSARLRRGLATDSDPLRFGHTLEPITQVFGAGGDAPGDGLLVVAMSVPNDDHLPPLALPDGGTGYVLRLRVTSADDSGHTTLDADSLIHVRTAHPLGRGEFLSLVRTYTLPATGDQRVRVILSDSARQFGAIRVVNGVPLPDVHVGRLTLTDPIVGTQRSGVDWRRSDGRVIPLNPLNAWRGSEPLELTLEAGGLAPGNPYAVRIAVGDLGADSTKPPKASVEASFTAHDPLETIAQSIDLHALKPGRYLLSVTVTANGASVRRDRRITIAGQ